MTCFRVGDIVRIRAARRRSASGRVVEVTPTIAVAVSERGEIRYPTDALELGGGTVRLFSE
jgi:hypothetical protein